jgi:hypothetical protein
MRFKPFSQYYRRQRKAIRPGFLRMPAADKILAIRVYQAFAGSSVLNGVDMIATPYDALLGKRREITGKHFSSLSEEGRGARWCCR